LHHDQQRIVSAPTGSQDDDIKWGKRPEQDHETETPGSIHSFAATAPAAGRGRSGDGVPSTFTGGYSG
jgi:hypothetical protein